MRLSRIIPPIITPFDQKGRVYEKGVHNLIDFSHEKGIRSLWILGSYGAFPLMSTQDRMRMAEIALPHARDLGVAIIVQIGSPSIDIALELAEHAEKAGADALASVVPFYYSAFHYKEDNLVSYFSTLLKNTGLPLIFYNNPKTTGYTPTVNFLRRILEAGVRGIKDTTSDFVSLTEKIRVFSEIRPDGFYLGGSSSVFLPVRAMGAPACVCGTAVALPEIVLRLDDAIERGDAEEARRVQDIVLKIRQIQGRYVARPFACYDILTARGVDVGKCRAPWVSMDKAQTLEVVRDLTELGAWS